MELRVGEGGEAEPKAPAEAPDGDPGGAAGDEVRGVAGAGDEHPAEAGVEHAARERAVFFDRGRHRPVVGEESEHLGAGGRGEKERGEERG